MFYSSLIYSALAVALIFSFMMQNQEYFRAMVDLAFDQKQATTNSVISRQNSHTNAALDSLQIP